MIYLGSIISMRFNVMRRYFLSNNWDSAAYCNFARKQKKYLFYTVFARYQTPTSYLNWLIIIFISSIIWLWLVVLIFCSTRLPKIQPTKNQWKMCFIRFFCLILEYSIFKVPPRHIIEYANLLIIKLLIFNY